MKRIVKETLAENYQEAIVVEKDLCVIGVIIDDEPSKESKYTGKRSQASIRKAKEKEFSDLKILRHTIKSISNELEKLKQKSSETTISSKPPRFNILRRAAKFGCNNNQLDKSKQSLNIVLNVESMGMDQYCLFHQEYHLEKTCPQWNHNINSLVVYIIDTVLSDEKTDSGEEKEETATTKQTTSVGHVVNTLGFVHASEKKSVVNSH